jgi:cytochrome c oxidase subunit 4
MIRYRPLLLVWLCLLILLGLTVGLSTVLHGPMSLAAGLLIACVKTALIFYFYMNLKSENGLVRLAALGAFAWLLLFLFLAATDYSTRPSPTDLISGGSPGMGVQRHGV